MGHDGDILAELAADHRAVERLFDEIQLLAPGDPKRKEIADRFTIELVRHFVAEEMHLLPAVRSHLDGGDVAADRGVMDNQNMERALKRMEGLDVPTTEFNRLVQQLVADVRTHVTEQENLLFPLLAEACSPAQLDELGAEVRSTRDRAPTRPHPAMLHNPPAERLLVPGLGLVDRARDRASGRGR